MKKILYILLLLPMWVSAQKRSDVNLTGVPTQSLSGFMGGTKADSTLRKLYIAYGGGFNDQIPTYSQMIAYINSHGGDTTKLITTSQTPQTKKGGIILGKNTVGDTAYFFGTSVTFQRNYSTPFCTAINAIQVNNGVSGSIASEMALIYNKIPRVNSGNKDRYRYLMIEYSINDAQYNISISAYCAAMRANIDTVINRGWAKDRIIINNGNYCSRSDMVPKQKQYCDSAISIAKQKGVQYADVYTFTKNNGGNSLLTDSIHPTPYGGLIYAKGLAGQVQGGLSAMTSLSSNGGILIAGDGLINGADFGTGGDPVNTKFGRGALTFNVGSYNTAFGNYGLHYNTTGGYNTVGAALGLFNNVTGSFSTANGEEALFNYTGTSGGNDGGGYKSLWQLIDGHDNSAPSTRALYDLKYGNHNLGVGAFAGYGNPISLATLNDMTFVGYGTTATKDTLQNSTALGSGATVTKNNQMVFGNGSVTENKFHGNLLTDYYTGYDGNNSQTGRSDIILSGGSSNDIAINSTLGGIAFGHNGVRVASIGNTGIGTFPSIKLTTGATNGYVLTSDASGNGTWAAAASPISFADNETPSGTVNGSNVTFTLSHTPTTGSVHLYLNGQRQQPTTDYSISGSTITFVSAPLTGDLLLTDYRY